MSIPSLADIATELYAAAPEDFIAARNARAKETTDAALAAGVRALRKPSVAAWVVNLFAQERRERLAEALTLAEQLREAQADLDAKTLAALGRQRRALTRSLADEAASLAESRSGRVTTATCEAVHQTITAAFFDPDAAAAVASGRLVRELEPDGDTAAVAASVAGGAPEPARPVERPADELRARRERREADRALRDAEQALTRAERDRSAVAREKADAVDRATALEERVRELEDELTRIRERLSAARESVDDLDERARDAGRAATAAERAVAAARTALDAL